MVIYCRETDLTNKAGSSIYCLPLNTLSAISDYDARHKPAAKQTEKLNNNQQNRPLE